MALPLAGLAIAGCGGGTGDDESTSSASASANAGASVPQSRAELIEQGDALCAKLNAAIVAVGTSGDGTSSVAGQAATLYTDTIDSLKEMGASSGGASYSEFISGGEKIAAAENEVKLAVTRDSGTGLPAAETELSIALIDFREAAQEYGFQECGEGTGAPPVGEAFTPDEAG